MASFCVLVSASPFSSQGHSTARNFCAAAIEAGHDVPQIFFYHEAVLVASESANPPSDELNPAQQWLQLPQSNHRELVVCVAAAQRRGVSDGSDENKCNLADGYAVGGLGLLAEAMNNADRFIHFG